MNQSLAALFAQHRAAVLGGGAAAVAGLALWQRRKTAASSAARPAGASAGATVPGTMPAAAVVSGTAGGGYDSTATDIWSALQPELDQLRQTSGTGVTSAPAPLASSLFAPTYNGHYAATSTGQPVEIESDGSLFHLNQQFIDQVNALGGKYSQLASDPGWYSLTGNLQAVQSGTTPGLMRYDSTGNLVSATPTGKT